MGGCEEEAWTATREGACERECWVMDVLELVGEREVKEGEDV